MATAFKNISNEQWLDSSIRMGMMKGFHSARTLLTPDLAQALLERNPSNRPVTAARVRTYARDIREGRWQFNGETIIVSDDGRVNDGQHRCLAVIEANEPIDTAIVFGPSYDSRKTTDIGSAKNAGSFLGMDGIPHAATVAGIVRLLLTYEQTGGLHKASKISNTAVLERASCEMDEVIQTARFAHGHSTKLKPFVAPSPFGFCYHICRARHPEKAQTFFWQVATGELLAHGDPALAVRNRLGSMGKAPAQDKAEVILHGWNAFAKGEKRTFTKVVGQLPQVA